MLQKSLGATLAIAASLRAAFRTYENPFCKNLVSYRGVLHQMYVCILKTFILSN